MANPDFTEGATVTLRMRMKKACDQIGRATFLMNKLDKVAKTVNGSNAIIENIKYGRNDSGAWYEGYETLPIEQQKLFTAIQNPWAQYAKVVSFCGRELKENRGEHQVLNLMTERMDDLQDSHMEDWNEIIATANGSDPRCMHGLPHLLSCDPYGGIDPSVKGCEFWKPWWCNPLEDWLAASPENTVDNFRAPPLTWKKFREMAFCIDGGKSRPDCIVLSKDLWLGLLGTLEKGVAGADSSTVSFGIESISYLGMSFGFDWDLPDGSWYALNMKYLTWWRQAGCFMNSTGFKTPYDQDAMIAHVLSMTQLTTCKRNAHGVGQCFRPAC